MISYFCISLIFFFQPTMACATLKRPLEWDPLNSPSQSSSPNPTRPTKRRCLMHHNYNSSPYIPPKGTSPFDGIHPKLTAGTNEYILHILPVSLAYYDDPPIVWPFFLSLSLPLFLSFSLSHSLFSSSLCVYTAQSVCYPPLFIHHFTHIHIQRSQLSLKSLWYTHIYISYSHIELSIYIYIYIWLSSIYFIDPQNIIFPYSYVCLPLFHFFDKQRKSLPISKMK